MKALISRSNIKGKVTVPPSKSYTIRGLVCAALSRGESEIINPLGSGDTEACQDVLGEVGVSVSQHKNSWKVIGGDFHQSEKDLFCRESAATLRFMTAICSLIPGQSCLTSAPSLSRRPVEPLIRALKQLGVDCRYQEKEACIIVNGSKLKGGATELPGNISSQFVSALLFISPFAEKGMSIRLTTPLESQSFVLMTLECLKQFGIKVKSSENLREYEISKQAYIPTKYRVEGDWSSASYLLTLGALCGEVEVKNLNPDSLQGDKVILEFLKEMGALVNIGKNSVTVKRSGLKAIQADLTDCIDLLPTMAVLAAVAEGISEFTGIERARLKESDRPSVVKEGLQRMGIKIVEEKNRLVVVGGPMVNTAIDSRGDHRIAMAFSLLGFYSDGVTINNAECVSKTYPVFWDIMKRIGGEVKIDEQ